MGHHHSPIVHHDVSSEKTRVSPNPGATKNLSNNSKSPEDTEVMTNQYYVTSLIGE